MRSFQARQTASEEAEAAKKNLAKAEEKAAADLAEENAVLDAAREAYKKAQEEAEAAAGSEDAAERNVKEFQDEIDGELSKASKAEDGAKSERDSAEKERFDAEVRLPFEPTVYAILLMERALYGTCSCSLM
jgi:hypothetical protein